MCVCSHQLPSVLLDEDYTSVAFDASGVSRYASQRCGVRVCRHSDLVSHVLFSPSVPLSGSLSRIHGSSLSLLESLQFTLRVPWPASILLHGEALAEYQRISALLMQVHRAKHALDSLGPMPPVHAGQHAHALGLLRFQCVHFVNALQTYLVRTVRPPLTHSLTVFMRAHMLRATCAGNCAYQNQKYALCF